MSNRPPPPLTGPSGSLDESLLRANEERLRLALDAGHMGTWDWDIRTGAVTWSANLEAIHGLSPGAFSGSFTGFMEGVHPDDRTSVQQTFAQTLEQGTEHNIEYRIQWPDGSVHWLEGRGRLFLGEGGEPARMIGVCADITERKNAALALRESEQRYKRLLQSATDYIYTVKCCPGHPPETAHGPGCEAVTGYPAEAFHADPYLWFRMIAAEDRDAVLAQIAQVESGTAVPPFEHRIVRRNGSIRWIRNTPVLRRDEQGRLTAYDGLIADITERKLAEEALQKHDALLQAIIEGTTDAVFVKDRQGRYLMINTAGARFLGRTAAEVIGKDDTELFSPDSAQPIMEGDRRVMATGEIQTYEDVGTAAGYTRTYLSTKGPYRDQHGNVIGLIGISRDITERKLADRRGIAEHAVTRVLAASAGLREATPKIIQAVCANLGWDLGTLWQVDRQAGVLRCVEVWREPGIDAAGFEQLWRQITFAPGAGLPGRVWASGVPAWIANVVEDPNFPRFKAARLAGLHAGFAFPVSNGKEFLGVLEFFSREIREPEEALLAMMDSISSQIGQFIERRQAEKALHKREGELGLARQIQQGLLPRSALVLDGFDMDGVSLPAQETGGDYLDFIPAEDGRLGIAIGDASGHGIAAALLMAETRAYLRALLLNHADAGRILSLANRNLVKDIERDWFVTLFLAFLDPRARTLVSCGAGHNPAYVLDSRGEVKTILTSVAMPLGIEAGTAYAAGPAVQLESGDLVFLYTDGIIEASPPGSARFGIERALNLIRAQRHEPARRIVDALLQTVRGYCGTAPSDDMTAIILKVE